MSVRSDIKDYLFFAGQGVVIAVALAIFATLYTTLFYFVYCKLGKHVDGRTPDDFTLGRDTLHYSCFCKCPNCAQVAYGTIGDFGRLGIQDFQKAGINLGKMLQGETDFTGSFAPFSPFGAVSLQDEHKDAPSNGTEKIKCSN